MDNIQKFSDLELFSELFDNPINPLFLNMVPQFVGENSPMFHLQINGEAVLKWREVYGRPRTVFDLLNGASCRLDTSWRRQVKRELEMHSVKA